MSGALFAATANADMVIIVNDICSACRQWLQGTTLMTVAYRDASANTL